MKWCFPCCEPELPDVDVNMSCPSACCVINKAEEDTSEAFKNQAKERKTKTRKNGRKRRRHEKKTE